MLGSTHTVFSSDHPQHSPYNLIAQLPDEIVQNPKIELTLRFFRVSLPMVLAYVLQSWAMFAAVSDDMIYEHCTEEITGGDSIFYVGDPEQTQGGTGNMEFYQHYEILMDLIYKLRDQLLIPLDKVVDVSNDRDATQLGCRAVAQDCVVISVHPEYETDR